MRSSRLIKKKAFDQSKLGLAFTGSFIIWSSSDNNDKTTKSSSTSDNKPASTMKHEHSSSFSMIDHLSFKRRNKTEAFIKQRKDLSLDSKLDSMSDYGEKENENPDDKGWYIFKSLGFFRRYLSTMFIGMQNQSAIKFVNNRLRRYDPSKYDAYDDEEDDSLKRYIDELNANQLLYLLISLCNEIANYCEMDVLINDVDLDSFRRMTQISRMKVFPDKTDEKQQESKSKYISYYKVDGQLLAKIFASLVVYSKNERFVDIIIQRFDLLQKLLNLTYLDRKVQFSPPNIIITDPNNNEVGMENKPDEEPCDNVMKNFDEDGYPKDGSNSAHRHYNSNPTSDALEDILNYDVSKNKSVKFDNDPRSSRNDCPKSDKNEKVFLNLDLQCQVELATFLANISRLPATFELFKTRHVEEFLNIWKKSNSLHLCLLSNKISLNLQTFESKNNAQSLYFHDIYRLDHPDVISKKKDFDIIFLNGMNGSVFYTWRQHEKDQVIRSIDRNINHIADKINLQEPYTKCWPRDWLSTHYPNARVIGVNVSLKPFLWNSICPHDKKKRMIKDRAIEIATQLRLSGVGERPIIWISHSAGGIIVKEIIRLVKDKDYLDSYLDTIATKRPLQSRKSSEKIILKSLPIQSNQFTKDPTMLDNVTTDPSDMQFDLSKIHTIHRDLQSGQDEEKIYATIQIPDWMNDEDERGDLEMKLNHLNLISISDNTQGIIFISTPHKGNQSLFTLYHYPFKLALTPEAKELQRNSAPLIDLHEWFLIWQRRRKVSVMNMVETDPTKVNNFYSCILVPEDPKDAEYSRIIRVKSDHIYISKPNSPQDEQFEAIIDFIKDVLDNPSPENIP